MLETDYEFVERIQLTTSRAKTDVYFAADKVENKFVVVKGPLQESNATNTMAFLDWKKNNGLLFVDQKVVRMIPNRWDSVPLGLRNQIDRTVAHPFLVSESAIPRDRLKYTTRRSKLWPATRVVDWTKTGAESHPDGMIITPFTLSDEQMKDYVRALLARWVFGVGDLADRNFILINGRVVSIDEEYVGRPVRFASELRRRKCEHIQAWLRKHSAVDLDIDGWDIPFESKRITPAASNYERIISLFSAV